MAKRIEVPLQNGDVDVYPSNLIEGYHKHENDKSVCISKKTLFGEEIVRCYSKNAIGQVKEERCKPCEKLNPTQTSDIRIQGEKPK
jgi:hypothetical protein